MPITDEQLLSFLQASNVIQQPQLDVLIKFSQDKRISFWDALLEQKVLTDKNLGMIVANNLKLPFIDLSQLELNEAVLSIIPERIARAHHVICFARDQEMVKLATSNPNLDYLLPYLQKKMAQPITVYYATDREIERILANFTKNLQHVYERLIEEDNPDTVLTGIHDPPVSKMVDLLIQSALDENASDIHIEPQEEKLVVRFRIDGILRNILDLPKNLLDRIVTRIKVLSKLRTDEHLSAQDGKIRMTVVGEKLDLRVSIIPISDGEKVVMRLLTSRAASYSLSNLGMSDVDLLKVNTAVGRSYGMIISTGPTGSGKTTTIYSILKTINVREKNLTTIEDPIEYKIKGANQVQVNTKTNLTFAKGLRSLLRQDPDYIFVGEIRDNETAAIATNAALTGHLVFSTLHTNTAAAALPRLIDMEVEPFLVASTVHLIIAQRLLRKVCEHCRVAESITVDEFKKRLSLTNLNPQIIPLNEQQAITVYHGQGCKECRQSGYSGRVGVYEILEITKQIRSLIVKKSDADTIQQMAIQEGMASMLDDAIKKLVQGLTTIEEIVRVIRKEAE